MQVASEQFGALAQFIPVMNQSRAGFSDHLADVPSATDRVLIMEGSSSLARLLATGLSAESLAVDVTHDLASAMEQIEKRSYKLLLIDLDQHGIDGLAMLGHLRAKRPDMLVLVLSGHTGVEGLVTALDHGADDYLIKPFSLLEMMARVRALRRRSTGPTPQASKLTLHRDQCRVERDGRNIDLTPREFALLDFMMQNAGTTLSRAMLTQQVWNMPAEGNTNIVDVYVKYLRDKLDGDSAEKLIRTVRGVGYLFQIHT